MIKQIKKASKRFLVLLFCSMLAACQTKLNTENENMERIVGIKSNYLASGKAIDGTDYYIISRNDGREGLDSSMIIETVPSIYAIDMQMLSRRKDLGLNKEHNQIVNQRLLEVFLVNLYGLDSNLLIKTIDIKKIMEQEEKEIQLAGIGDFETRSIDGMPYLGFLIEDYPEKFEKEMESTRRMYWINLETEKTLESEERDWSRKFPMEDAIRILQDDLFADNNFSFEREVGSYSFYVENMNYWEGCCTISLRLELIPESNAKLHAMFPKLKEQVEEIKKQEGEYWIQIYLTGNPTPTEVMELCLPEGQEVVFEEMILPAESTIDGKEHTVRSLEEYEKYIKLEDGDATGVNPIFESRP